VPLPFPDVPLVAGALLGWSLAAPPGPGNALIAQDAARRGWLAGLATGAGAITADFVMFLLMWLGVLRLLTLAPWLLVVLGVVGALLMGKYALDAYRSARRPATADPHARGGYWKTFLAIVTSPFNHVWWVSSGTVVFANLGAGLISGFFGSLVLWVMFWSALATLGAAKMRRFGEIVGYASAVVLAVFAVVILAFTVREAMQLTGA
jgi:threonine/homoserine/homoserine lactone efflux protein